MGIKDWALFQLITRISGLTFPVTIYPFITCVMKYSRPWLLLMVLSSATLVPAVGRSYLTKQPLIRARRRGGSAVTSHLYPTQKLTNIKSSHPHEEKFLPLVPLYPSELPKFLALSSMMFWIVLIFTIARDTKDTLVVTSSGAEAISFLKVCLPRR